MLVVISEVYHRNAVERLIVDDDGQLKQVWSCRVCAREGHYPVARFESVEELNEHIKREHKER